MDCHQILFNPLIPGEFLLKPVKYLGTNFSESQAIEKIIWVALFILCAPIILPMALSGFIVKAIYLKTGNYQTTPNRPLFIEEVTRQFYPNGTIVSDVSKRAQKVYHTAQRWMTLAEKKFNAATLEGEKDIFSESAEISCYITKFLKLKNFSRIVLCRDVNLGSIQAIALVEKIETFAGKYLFIGNIVTNPANVRSVVNAKEYARVEGAGSCIIEHLKKSVKKEKCQGIYLEAASSAKTFYAKKGFKEYIGGQITRRCPQLPLTPMILT